MGKIIEILQANVSEAVSALYQHQIPASSVTVSATRKEFVGNFTVVTFPFLAASKKKLEDVGTEIGNYLLEKQAFVTKFNVIKGFLNVEISETYWKGFLEEVAQNPNYGTQAPNHQKVMVEFSSPNTNKPLHLGHIRNILLGWSCAKILQAAGYDVVKTQVINDRGIAICKSMLAWQLFGENKTPQSTATKGDHFVGEYYVLFEKKFKEEYKNWQESDIAKNSVYPEKKKLEQSEDDFFATYKNTYFNEHSALGKQARELLQKWESGDTQVVDLWRLMNSWVYEGFEKTYQKLGVNFDKNYYESNTYLQGKEMIAEALKKNIFYQKSDNSVWIDLTDVKLDQKLVLRSDGTSVYITQDIGMAQTRYQDFEMKKLIYVVADEQNYHFQVLFEIMKKLGEPYSGGLFHLSYGMVDLPTGKMKSREGTVVDADDLMAEVIEEARKNSKEHENLNDFVTAEKEEIIRKIGLAALKYHILKVHPKKRMVFDPQESLDMQGQTGPYVQYSYVRIKGVLRRAELDGFTLEEAAQYADFQAPEQELILLLHEFPSVIEQAAKEYDPSLLAHFAYSTAKSFHKFWHDLPIYNAESIAAKAFRLKLSESVGKILHTSMDLLGIELPEKM